MVLSTGRTDPVGLLLLRHAPTVARARLRSVGPVDRHLAELGPVGAGHREVHDPRRLGEVRRQLLLRGR